MQRRNLHHAHRPKGAADAAQRRMYFKITVGAGAGVLFIGWVMLLKYTVSQGPPPRAVSDPDAARIQISEGLKQIQDEIKRLPSIREFINQINAQASTTQEAVASLASKIAGQATSSASTTASSLPTTTPEIQ